MRVTLLTLDFESFYSTDFSLSKLTTEEYIRDAQFETIGVSVQVNAGEPLWFSGPKAAVKKFLDQFPWDEATAVAHNAMFDMAILNWHFDIRPKRIVDTMSMARALVGSTQSVSLKALAEYYGVGVKGNEVIAAKGMRRADFSPEELSAYGSYCNNDTNLCYQLFEKMLPGFPRSELRLIDLTIRMFTEPVFELDRPLLEKHLGQVQRKKEAMLARVEVHKDQIMSNPQLALLLTELGVDPPMKTSLTTGKETFAFAKSDEEFLELLEHPDLRVQTLVGVRLGVKSTLEETRTQRFIDISGRGLMPIPLRYYAAHTGRWGGCLVGDTEVIVYNLECGVQTKRIVDVLLDDLVWDGEEFVAHEGVVFSGYSEVTEWDGVKGTEDHVVFTDAGEISLRDAMQGAHRIKAARSPSTNDVDAARQLASKYET